MDEDNHAADTIRLRIYWGGGRPQQWQGSIELGQGNFKNSQVLGVSADSSAAVVVFDQRLQISHWSAISYGGIDVDVPLIEGNRLKLNLRDRNNPDLQFEQTVLLTELLQSSFNKELDGEGNRIVIARAPGDRLPIRISREHLIFEPQEQYEFGLRVNHTDWVSQRVNCRIRLQSSASINADRPLGGLGAAITANFHDQEQSKTVQFDLDAAGSSGEQMVGWEMPKEEGVYTLTFELASPWQQASFKTRSTVRRQVQLVVLAAKPAAAMDRKVWKRIATIDPARDPANLPNTLLSLGRKTETSQVLGNDLRNKVMIDGEPMLDLEVGGWQAIPVAVEQFDRPHLIEIEYLADQPTSLGISFLEPNTNGQIPSYGVDSGLHIPPSLIDVNAKTARRLRQRHQVVCWPQEKLSYLLIVNRDPQHKATIGKIEVLAGPDRLTAEKLPHSKTQSEAAKTTFGDTVGEKAASIDHPPHSPTRKFMAFSEAGLFAKNFGGREGIDLTGNSFDDWQTFFSGADRFVQYLKSHGYSGAFVTVATDGSTLYPSQVLGNTPRLDSGQLFSTGQDPIRKDVLELLFRLCEREGLTLVPAVIFNGALPEIEKEYRRAEGANQAVRLVHWNGSPGELKTKNNFPIYNPLNSRVQKQAVKAVEELTARYHRFGSFGGIAIVCRPDTFVMLPGQQWCYDDETLARFWSESFEAATKPEGREQLLEQVLGTHQERWFQWRSQSIANWYGELGQSLRKYAPKATLFLAPVDLYRHEELEAVLAPNLHSSVDFRKQMLRLGWDAGQLASLDGVKLLKPKRLAPNQSLAQNRLEISVDNQRNADDFFQQAQAIGDLFVSRVPWAHFSQLQETAPFQTQQSALMRMQPLAPAGVWSRQRFLNALRASDAQYLIDGGLLLPIGQEHELREFVSVFGRLPQVPFIDVVHADSSIKSNQAQLPVVVRHHSAPEGLWFYAVNASFWPCRVRLKLNVDPNQSKSIRMLSGVSINESVEGESHCIEFELGPLSMTGGVLSGTEAIESFQFELPSNAADRLRKQIHVLQAKLLKSTNSQPLDVLKNGGFEVQGQPSLSGWEFGQQGTQGVSLSNQEALEGESILRMKNENTSPVWIRSNEFPLPETGRLSISVWLRTPDPAKQPPLRIAIEGTAPDANYYRFGSIGGLSPDPQFNQISDQWQRFALHFDDLPIERLTSVRVGLDLMGVGIVDVDNFEVFDRWFDERDAKAINQRLASSGPLLANPNTFESCRLLLGSYWLRFLDENIRDTPGAQLAGSRDLDGNSTPEDSELSNSSDGSSLNSSVEKTEAEAANDSNERGLFRRIRRQGNRIQR